MKSVKAPLPFSYFRTHTHMDIVTYRLTRPRRRFSENLAYKRPLNLSKCADNIIDTTALYHCNLQPHSTTAIYHCTLPQHFTAHCTLTLHSNLTLHSTTALCQQGCRKVDSVDSPLWVYGYRSFFAYQKNVIYTSCIIFSPTAKRGNSSVFQLCLQPKVAASQK